MRVTSTLAEYLDAKLHPLYFETVAESEDRKVFTWLALSNRERELVGGIRHIALGVDTPLYLALITYFTFLEEISCQ